MSLIIIKNHYPHTPPNHPINNCYTNVIAELIFVHGMSDASSTSSGKLAYEIQCKNVSKLEFY